jgi:hypothetical protein
MLKTSTTCIALACLAVFPATAFADDAKLPVFAAMAKIEANVFEVAKAVFAAAVPGIAEDVRTSATSEIAEDKGQIEFYIGQLQGMELTDDQKAAVAAFGEQWPAIMAEAESLVATPEDSDAYRGRLATIWGQFDAMDEVIDSQLEAIMTEAGLPLPAN